MASSIETSKISGHFRSISLPSRSHPLTTTAEEHLSRLRSSEAASSSSSASQILGELKSLYDCIDDLLQLPLTQQVLSHLKSRRRVVGLFSHALRRLREREGSFLTDEGMYPGAQINFEKKERRGFQLRRRGFLALTSASTKPRGWSRVSKLLGPKRVSCDGGKETNEVQGLDALVLSLRSSKDINNQVGDLSKRLEELEASIQEIEDELECIFRRLVMCFGKCFNGSIACDYLIVSHAHAAGPALVLQPSRPSLRKLLD
ncbi:uncharacterized protein LOC120294370 [Eucalyptus grandis]|uniref:uncharacterized protein LOC120294370 n=1 Tax=Eucalyptus grandis TaxID=71139 RepID=UPI00192E7B67|nr:uncharacterized protein LOC120294370 [Eucalyptus grandis]